MKKKIPDVIAWIWIVEFILVGIKLLSSLGGDTVTAEQANEPICRTEAIAFEKTEEESEYALVGTSEITTDGVEGERRICELDGIEQSNQIITEPIAEVTTIGTGEPYVLEEEEVAYRVGAYCVDGSYSYATGRGACSHHGGVREWAYN